MEQDRHFHELTLDEFRQFSDLFDEGVLEIDIDRSIGARDVPGGTSPTRVDEAIVNARQELEVGNGV